LVGIHLRPHDLRRHSASYASRSGTPLEIISKILLRHSNLSLPKFTWEKSAMLKRCAGLITCTGNATNGRAGDLTSVRLFQRSCSKINDCICILNKSGL
jgi:hypothetical protein